MTSLRATGVTVSLGGARVLDGVSLQVQPGWTAIVGPNGAGKSTLLRVLAGLRAPDAGQVLLDGAPLPTWAPLERARRIAWLTQQGSTTGDLTAREIVLLGRLPHLGIVAAPGAADHAAVDRAMEEAECAMWRDRRPQQLSGGEQQRVLLARALAVEAPLLLLDEPTTHLDPPHQASLARLFRRRAAAGTTVVSVLHDLSLALVADRLVLIERGRVRAEGPTGDGALHAALVDAFQGAIRIQRVEDRWIAFRTWSRDVGRAVMVLGTSSGAGKSWLATALCRWYARQGLVVAPFKAQNMSNNARVVPALDGTAGEIGSAQYFQALAARARPDVRMNPVLLKPEDDTASQVVVLGQVRADLAAEPWRSRSEKLWPYARDALQALLRQHELVVIEGAGSPAEINLSASDYVNMRTAREASAACLLVADIDRGGAFAHLYGTHQLLPPEDRARIRGFVVNRFRGDARLLAPAPEDLARLTGVPTVGVLPMWREHGLPEEDGLLDGWCDEGAGDARAGRRDALRVAVVTFPRVSNLDELQPLRRCPGVRLHWARTARALEGADWIVLPGSKHTSGDLAWLRAGGIDDAILRHAACGGRVLGLCGGLQMLGEALIDPRGVDGSARGLGLLPLQTTFQPPKLLRHTRASFAATRGGWSALGDLAFDGYEIRHGRSILVPSAGEGTIVALRNEAGEPIGWQRDNVLGLYTHGLFESPAVMTRLFGTRSRSLDQVFDGLADFIESHFQPGVLRALAGGA